MICKCAAITVTRELVAKHGYRKIYEKCPKCGRVEFLPIMKLTEADLELEKLKNISEINYEIFNQKNG